MNKRTYSRAFSLVSLALWAGAVSAACSSSHGNDAVTHDRSRLAGGGEGDESPDGGVAAQPSNADGGTPDESPNGAQTGSAEGSDKADAVELGGVDTDGDGFSDAVEESESAILGVSLAESGADPLRKDVFVYYDYYEEPSQTALELVEQAFDDAPVTVPGGEDGINLHLIKGRQIPSDKQVQDFNRICDDADTNDWSEFDAKIKKEFFPPEWAKVAHYVLLGKDIGAGNGRSGCSRGIPGHDVIISLGSWKEGWRDMVFAGTFMHELGHNLGLTHDGQDPTSEYSDRYPKENTYMPNLLSIMSYAYQIVGVPYEDGSFVLDYSRTNMAELDEQSLDEDAGLTTDDEIAHYTAIFGYQVRTKTVSESLAVAPVQGDVTGWLDFNGNGTNDHKIPGFDIDGDPSTTYFPATMDQWENLIFTGNAAWGGGEIGDVGKVGTARYVDESNYIGPAQMPFELRDPDAAAASGGQQ